MFVAIAGLFREKNKPHQNSTQVKGVKRGVMVWLFISQYFYRLKLITLYERVMVSQF